MPSLADLKKKSQEAKAKLIESTKEKPFFENNKDERYWTYTRDDAGNAFAVIRFLPVPAVDFEQDNALSYVKIYSHSFKNNATGKWYINKSLSTFNEPDPVGELNRKLWDEGNENQARNQKRKLDFVSNIYVVKDPANPENEGRVFLFRYGKKIFDKISALLNPDEAFGEEPVDPFDLENGRNFRLKVKTIKVDDKSFPNYDSSEWETAGPISDKNGKPLSETTVEEIWKSEYSLLELLDRKHFLTYDELKKKLDDVMGVSSNNETTKTEKVERKGEPTQETKRVETKKDDTDLDDTDALINEWINGDDD